MAQLLSTNVSGNLIVTQSANVAGNLIVSGYNVMNEIFQADNTARVTANSGSTQSAVSLNFVNTATVTVSVTSGGAGVANIGFTSTASGSGTVTSVDTGLGLKGGGFTTTGTISANIANTTVQGVTKLIDIVTSTDSGNAATANIVNIVFNQATNAYTQANTANSIAISAYGQANAAYTQANTANSIAISAYGQANAAFIAANNAANTVRVTANSGSAQSAVSLNFVNTATIRVSVGAGTVGNANVSFDYIGSVTGSGSGINTFPVSANSGSTVTANGLNFLNSSSILISVSGGTTGNANVTLTATNISDNLKILSGATRSSNVQMLSDGRLTEWSHLRDGNILNTTENTNSGVFAKPDGTIIYIVGQALDNVQQFALSTAWNVATGTLTQAYNVSSQETTSADLFFKSDGSVLYVLGDVGNDITYWSLSESWNVGSTLTLGGTYSVSAQTSSPRGFHFSNDGTKFWVSSLTQVFQYTVATPWTLSTATYDNKVFTQALESQLQSVSLNPSGNIMLLLGSTNDAIYEYYLSAANDVTTAAYTGRIKDASRKQGNSTGESTPAGMFVAYPNNRMYIVGSLQTSIIEYKTDNGLTLDADMLSVEGAVAIADSLIVGEDIRVRDSVAIDNGLSVGGALTMSGTGTFSQSGGDGNYGGSTSATPTYKLGYGAMPSGTKTIEVGTNATGGNTNITVGTAVANSTLIVYANTATFSNAVNIAGQLTVAGFNIINELAIADNTTAVSANSGSILSAVSLNFVNTASVNVSVTSGGAGIANIAFTSSGGTGGLSNFPVSGNTAGPTVSASGINFNNTATIRVSVGSGVTGNANVSFDYIGSSSGLSNFPVSDNGLSTVTATGINFNDSSTGKFAITSGTTGNANVQLTVIPAFTTEINTTSTLNVTGATTLSNTLTISMNNGSDALRVTQVGTGNVIIFEDDANPDVTPFVVHSTGRVGIGTTTPTTTLDIVGSANVSASLNVGGYNILNKIFQADNAARVFANSGSMQANVSLNFVNTATVIVSVGPGTTGNANVSFSVNTSKIIFVGTTAPANPAVGDLWVDTN